MTTAVRWMDRAPSSPTGSSRLSGWSGAHRNRITRSVMNTVTVASQHRDQDCRGCGVRGPQDGVAQQQTHQERGDPYRMNAETAGRAGQGRAAGLRAGIGQQPPGRAAEPRSRRRTGTGEINQASRGSRRHPARSAGQRHPRLPQAPGERRQPRHRSGARRPPAARLPPRRAWLPSGPASSRGRNAPRSSASSITPSTASACSGVSPSGNARSRVSTWSPARPSPAAPWRTATLVEAAEQGWQRR